MASKLISVRDDIYKKLERLKLDGESFSDVISRLIASVRKDPLRHFGIGKELPAPINDTFEECIEAGRKANLRRETRLQSNLEHVHGRYHRVG